MIILKRDLECPHCEHINKVDLNDYVDDVSSYERNMGTETEYTITDCNIECKNCKKEFAVSGSIFEYPEGSENTNTLEISEL